MITFEEVVEENLYIAREMVHSNSSYLDNGKMPIEEYVLEFLSPNSHSFLIKVEDTYIGLTRYHVVPEEMLVSIDFFIIHADYQGFGYGTAAYYELEEAFKNSGYKKISVNVRSKHERIRHFWERIGFSSIKERMSKGEDTAYYEKQLV